MECLFFTPPKNLLLMHYQSCRQDRDQYQDSKSFSMLTDLLSSPLTIFLSVLDHCLMPPRRRGGGLLPYVGVHHDVCESLDFLSSKRLLLM